MIRGTTPRHVFRLPFSSDNVKMARVSYAQDGETVFTKTETACSIENDAVTVTLTQEDTLKFKPRRQVEIQLKVLTTSGEVLATRPFLVQLDNCLCEEVLA